MCGGKGNLRIYCEGFNPLCSVLEARRDRSVSDERRNDLKLGL